MKKKRTPKREHSPALIAMAERLRQLRGAHHWRQIQIANLTGISPSSWNSYEKGRKRISVDHAMQLSNVTGVPLDWIYAGKLRSSVPDDLAEKLGSAKKIAKGVNGHNGANGHKPPIDAE